MALNSLQNHEYEVIHRIKPVQCPFITGIAPSYSTKFPKSLENIVPKGEYKTAINRINDALFSNWP